MDFATAAEVVEGARDRARSRGESKLAPPYPLTDCDRGIIESALAVPGTAWGPEEKYPDLATKASALFYALAKSQACADGNKRIALLLTNAFIRINGGRFEVAHDEAVSVMLAVAASEAARRDEVVAELEEWMQQRVREENGS